MTTHSTKVFGQIQMISSEFDEVQMLRSALADTAIPFDADMVDAGVVRVDWHGPAVENLISASNDNFARQIDNIVRHPKMAGLGLYGQFMVISNGFNDSTAITRVIVRNGRVYVEKGETIWWSSPARRI